MQGHGITRHCQQPHAPACARHGHVLVLPWAARTRVSPSRRRNARVHEALRASGLRSVRGPKLARSRKTTRKPLVVFTGSWPRARACAPQPSCLLSRFYRTVRIPLYRRSYLCTYTSVQYYSTRPTISLTAKKTLSTSNKPITHYNVHCRLCRTGTPNRNTVERKTVRIHIRT